MPDMSDLTVRCVRVESVQCGRLLYSWSVVVAATTTRTSLTLRVDHATYTHMPW